MTNAAGALDPEFAPGDVMLIEDHLNFTGAEPADRAERRRASACASPTCRAPTTRTCATAARAAAAAAGIPLRHGIYAGVAGPSLETSAERRFLRAAGADAVGMSTVIEVIAAVHAGLRVLGLSAITNDAERRAGPGARHHRGGAGPRRGRRREDRGAAGAAAAGALRLAAGKARSVAALALARGALHEPLVRLRGDPARDRRRRRARAGPGRGAVERGADRLRRSARWRSPSTAPPTATTRGAVIVGSALRRGGGEPRAPGHAARRRRAGGAPGADRGRARRGLSGGHEDRSSAGAPATAARWSGSSSAR